MIPLQILNLKSRNISWYYENVGQWDSVKEMDWQNIQTTEI